MNPAVTRPATSRASRASAGVSQTALGIGLLQVVIIVLAVVTALVHLDKALTLGFPFGHPMGIQFGAPMGGAPHGAAPGAVPGHTAGGTSAGRPPVGHGPSLPLPLSVLFFLNFLGYIVLIAAHYLPVPILQRYRSVTRWLLIAFAIVTIWGYFAIVGEAPNALGAFDKAVEISLIIFLLIEAYYVWATGRQTGRQTGSQTSA